MNLADFQPSNSATPTPIEPASWMRSALLSLALSEKAHPKITMRFCASNLFFQIA